MFRENGLILVDLYVNGTKTFDGSNILSGTFSVNRFSSSAIAPEFGNVSSGELTFTIDTTTLTPTLQRGDIITGNLYLAEDTTETKAIGEFIVTNLVKGFNVLEVTCLDRMIELDIEADLSGVTYPITAEDFLTDVFGDTLGYTLNISNNVYKLVSLKQPVFEVGTTYRQVLSKVCECMGANAWYSDRLNIGWYTDSGETIDDSVYVNADLSDNGFGISVEVTQDPSQKAVDIGTTDITLRIVNNPFLANATAQERTAIATAIQTNIGNVTFYGAVMTVLPMPELNPMDVVEVDGKDVPITSITYGLNENTKLEGKIDSDNNTYNYTPQRDIAIMKAEVEEVKENNKHFFYLDDSGVHITMVENDYNMGNNILIDSDNVNVRQGTTTVASFGATTRIGEIGSSNIVISPGKAQIHIGESTPLLCGEIGSVNGNVYYTLGVRYASSVIGAFSVAEGFSEAGGIWSHSEGIDTRALGDYSHAQNIGTIANGDAQTVLGRFNLSDTTSAVIVGNGTLDTSRSNALTLDWNGNLVASGDITDGSGNKLSDANGWTTETASFNGVNVTVKQNKLIPSLIRVKLFGTLTQDVTSANAYVTVATTTMTFATATLGYVQFNAITGGQLRVTANGEIQIGYTRKYGENANSNLANGAGVYIDTALIVG